METSKTKKRLIYLAAFLVMLSTHYLIKDDSVEASNSIDMLASSGVRRSVLCLDQIGTGHYYRLNCPMCKTLIAAVSDNATFDR